MKKFKKTLVLGMILTGFAPVYSHAALQPSQKCEPLRTEVTEEDEHKYKYTNPYSVEDCDLGFDFPGFSFDIVLGGFDFCSIAKGVTSKARERWNDAVDDVNEWTDNTVDASVQDGVSVNGDNVTGGAGDAISGVANGSDGGADGGRYSMDYEITWDENGLPSYE